MKIETNLDLTKVRLEMDRIMAFRVGDAVALRSLVLAWTNEIRSDNRTPNPLRDYGKDQGLPAGIVIERNIQDCHGGTQAVYLVSRTTDQVRHERYFEYELMPYDAATQVIADARGVRDRKRTQKETAETESE